MGESGREMTILNRAGDESSPGDDRANGGESEDELCGVGEVKFGVHVDKMVGEEEGERGVEHLDDLGMGCPAKMG